MAPQDYQNNESDGSDDNENTIAVKKIHCKEQIPESIIIEKIEEKMVSQKKQNDSLSQNLSDFEEDKMSFVDNMSERNEDCNDSCFDESDENLKIKMKYLITLERKQGFMKHLLSKSVKVKRKDNIYYFFGDGNFVINSVIKKVKQGFIDYQKKVKVPKLFVRKKSTDPKLIVNAITMSKSFKNTFSLLKENFKGKGIFIDYITSQEYYNEYRFLGKRSKIITNKLNQKDNHVAFIRFVFSGRKEFYEIERAEKAVLVAMKEIEETNDFIFFKLKLPHIVSTKEVTIEIKNEARKQGIAIKFIQNKINNDLYFIEALIGIIYTSKKAIENFDFHQNMSVKYFCNFLKQFIRNEFLLGDDKNMRIYQLFLQDEIENKAKNYGIEIKLDKSNFLLKFNNGILYKEIQDSLQKYDQNFFDISFEIKTSEMPLKISEILWQEIYSRIAKIFQDKNTIGGMIEEKIKKINQQSKTFQLFFENKSDWKADDLSKIPPKIVLYFQALFEKNDTANFQHKFKSMLIKKFVEKFITVSFIKKDQKDFDENKLTQDFKCVVFKMINYFKETIFLIGKRKSIIMAQEYLKSQKITALTRINIMVPETFNRSEVFKQFKNDLREKNIISKTDRIEVHENKLILSSFSDNAPEIMEKISMYLKDFEKEVVKETEILDIYPNQIDYLHLKPEILKSLEEKYNVQIKINAADNKNCHFELGSNKKTLKLINDPIEECLVDAIINPHSEVLLSSENQAEGINKQILKKAGNSYKEELIEYIKLNKKLVATNIFISNSGNMKNCKKIMNVSVPIYDTQLTYRDFLAICYNKIFEEADHNGFRSIALPLIGAGTFGFSNKEVFTVLLQVIQNSFFNKKLNFLQEVYLCEINQIKIKELKNLLKKCLNQNKITKRDVRFDWKWLNDLNNFEDYEANDNENIDEAYEFYEKKQGSSLKELNLNIFRSPGSHEFDFDKMTVKDTNKSNVEALQNKNGDWYHNNEIYSNQISEILSINANLKKSKLQLFINSYFIDFKKMIQFNKISKFERKIQKIPKTKDNFEKNEEIQLLNFEKAVVFENGDVSYSGKNSITITSFLGIGKYYEAQKEIMNHLKSIFESYKIKIPGHLTAKKIENIKALCYREKIYCIEDLKPEAYIQVVGIKKNLMKFESELLKMDFPWDNHDDDFNLSNLNISDEEYKFVEQKFKKTMANFQIITIKRVENNELYVNYQENVKRSKELKKKNGMNLQDDDDKYEADLWHGTGMTNPLELIDRSTSCLSTQYAKDTCMWGRGIYFAENAAYSHNYSYKQLDSNCLLLCKVFIGESINLQPNNNLKEPPYKDKIKKIPYDSVQGVTGGSIVYIQYGDNKNYPFYLVEYKG